MTEDVNTQAIVEPAQDTQSTGQSEKSRENFARLEKAKEESAERAHKAEMEAALLKQRLDALEAMQKPKEVEVDPLDGMEDFVDPKALKAALDHREKRLKREAEEIADRRFKEWKAQEHQQNHVSRLKSEYPDYHEVMTEANIVAAEKNNPEFVQSLLHIKDDYERKKLAYGFMKRNSATKEAPPPTHSIKERVEENQRNPFYIPAGSGTPTSAVDFDIKSPQARAAAYAKLKAAQKRPIGQGNSQ